MTLIGAFDPAGKLDGLAIEHTFARADDPTWAYREIARITDAGRTPMLTVEPYGTGQQDAHLLAQHGWQSAMGRAWGGLFLRYQHEMNWGGHTWGGMTFAHKQAWALVVATLPHNVKTVWSPNVRYPGDRPLADYLPRFGRIDVVALDGYARHGETPIELFRPSFAELRELAPGKSVWIAETAAPRGRTQARYAEALVRFAEQQGIEAVCWFNVRKEGRDEADWRLTKAAQRAFLGKGGKS